MEIEWGEKFLIGDILVDSQHKGLIERYNKLVKTVQSNDMSTERSFLGFVLDDLVDYTVYHFHSEEILQRGIKYPGFKSHKKKHDGFIKKVLPIQEKFNEGHDASVLSEELLKFLKNWVENHILIEDKKIGVYLKKIRKSTKNMLTGKLMATTSNKFNSRKFISDSSSLITPSNRSIHSESSVSYLSEKRVKGGYTRNTFFNLPFCYTFILFTLCLLLSNLSIFCIASFVPLSFIWKVVIGGIVLLVFVVIIFFISIFYSRITKRFFKIIRKELMRISNLNLNLNSKLDKIAPYNYKEYVKIRRSIRRLLVGMENIFKFIPYEVLQEVLRDEKIVRLHLKERYVSIMFNDIENFTTISEKLSSKKLVEIIGEFFVICDTIVTEKEGTVLNYLGDGLLCIWNSPKYCLDHERKAVEATLSIMKRLDEFNAFHGVKKDPYSLEEEDKNNIVHGVERSLPELNVRFGLGSGKCNVGNVGSNYSMRYSCVGDFVNFCSRMEGLNKVYKTKILINEFTFKKMSTTGKDYRCRFVDFVQMKGKTLSLPVFTVRKGDQSNANYEKICDLSQLIYTEMSKKEINAGFVEEIAKKILWIDENDVPAKVIMSRIEEGMFEENYAYVCTMK